MKVTLSDVADKAGVSLATVSVVLSGSERVQISRQTKEHVQKVARELGYKTKSKKSKKIATSTKKIALLANPLDQDIFVKAILGAQEKAAQEEYVLHLIPCVDVLDTEVLRNLNLTEFDGVICASLVTQEIEKPDLPENLPVVLLNCWCKEKVRWPSIIPGDLTGGYLVTEHLLESGYKRIAFLGGESWMEATQSRMTGYRRALSSHDVPVDQNLMIDCDWRPKKAYAATKTLMQSANPPEAIFAASDRMCLGVYAALNELGLKIPQDVAVAGYDDSELASDLIPALTSYRLPYFEMGQVAVNMLLQIIAGQEPAISKIKHESELKVRQSTGQSA